MTGLRIFFGIMTFDPLFIVYFLVVCVLIWLTGADSLGDTPGDTLGAAPL